MLRHSIVLGKKTLSCSFAACGFHPKFNSWSEMASKSPSHFYTWQLEGEDCSHSGDFLEVLHNTSVSLAKIFSWDTLV